MALITTDDLHIAGVLNREIYRLMADTVDLRGTMLNAGNPAMSGSAAIKIRQILADEVMGVDATEVAAIGESTLATDAQTVTVQQYGLRYDVSDLFAVTEPDPERMAAEIVNALYTASIRTASDLITDLYTGFSQSAGTSGNAFSVDVLYDGQFLLQLQNYAYDYTYTVLHPKAFNELQSSIRGEGGAVQYSPDTLGVLGMKMKGYKGVWNNHFLFTSNTISSDGTDYHGGMYGPGALAISEASAEGLARMFGNPYAKVAIPGSPMWVEFQRKTTAPATHCLGHYTVGVIENEDLQGVDLVSVD